VQVPLEHVIPHVGNQKCLMQVEPEVARCRLEVARDEIEDAGLGMLELAHSKCGSHGIDLLPDLVRTRFDS
jgi:hypothetical protein